MAETPEKTKAVPKAPKRSRKSGALGYVLLGLVFAVGLGVLAYPTFSDYWNSLHSSRAIMSYTEALSGIDRETYDRLLEAAEAYNRGIPERGNPFLLSPEEQEEYPRLLDVTGTGVIGYIDVPVIGVFLPIYHGTSEGVLQTSIGHLEWTSLPVGGAGAHAVLSGHRGLPSARLFTDLDRLAVGDVFTLAVLDRTLTYEVDQILIVLPEEVSALQIVPGEDYCTLVTCTPYGINTHRMLVRGRRIENAPEARSVRVTADAVQVEPLIVAPVLAIPILIVLITLLSLDDSQRRRRERRRRE